MNQDGTITYWASATAPNSKASSSPSAIPAGINPDLGALLLLALRHRKMYAVAVADHQDAETALGGGNINDHASVYVVVMSGGTFIALEHLQGVAAPQGQSSPQRLTRRRLLRLTSPSRASSVT
jgi:hypothetical protein